MAFRDESKLELSALFGALRKAKHLTQDHIAESIGVKRSAIAQFEAGRASLSNDTLQQIAPILNLSPEYVINRDVYPFVSEPDEVIKLFIPENRLTGTLDYSLIYFIASARGNDFLKFIYLSPPAAYTKIIWPFDRTIYAVTIMDAHENVFLCRRQNGSIIWGGSITGERDLELKILEMAEQRGTRVSFKLTDMDTPHYETIRYWLDITREDIGPLFTHAEAHTQITPTLDEIILLELLRGKGIAPRDAIDILMKGRETNTPPQ